jgi:hypothetical protein
MLDDICTDLKTIGSVPSMLHRLHELAEADLEGNTLPPLVNRVLLDFFKQEKNIEDSVFSVNLVVAKFSLS